MSKLRGRMRDPASLIACGIYALLSFLIFGRGLVAGFAAAYVGRGVDSSFLMWALAWWPYALHHHLNPFLCRIVWAPAGFNLAWSGGIPLPALALAPLTDARGPLVAYNLLALAAPALAAISGYFLCRKLCNRFLASLIGGALFGFSPYALCQTFGGHTNLVLIFPLPLILLVALAGWRAELGSLSFVVLSAGLIVIQFLCSIELAATMAFFGALAVLVGWILGADHERSRLAWLTPRLAIAGVIAAVLLSPYLFYLFQPGAPHGAINSAGGYSADLANLLIPTRVSILGTAPPLEAITRHFPGNPGERGNYLGLPLIVILIYFGWTRRRDFGPRWIILMIAIVELCALGPRLRVAGWTGPGMPWKLAMHLPLIKNALPGRFPSYLFLLAAIVIALWLADKTVRPSLRIAGAILLVASLTPNLSANFWTTPGALPQFITTRAYRRYLRPGETVVALPFGISGNTMAWQAAADMYFKMAGGYTGITPREFEQWPIIRALATSTYLPEMSSQFAALMAAHRATAILADDAAQASWAPVLNALDPAPAHVAGIWIYRPRSSLIAASTSGLDWERRSAALQFAAELSAARDYLAGGRDPAELSPLRAQQLGLLPVRWVNDPDVRSSSGLYLGPWPDGRIAVGIVGSYPALRPLIVRYRPYAEKIFFPFPKTLEEPPRGNTFMRLLVMVFRPDALGRAVAAPAAPASDQAARLSSIAPAPGRFVPGASSR